MVACALLTNGKFHVALGAALNVDTIILPEEVRAFIVFK